LRIRRLSDSRDSARLLTRLTELVQEARARRDEDISFDVGRICQEVGLNTTDAIAHCCQVLDSERFARTHRLWYHHRTGIWGTAEAKYTFLLNASGYRGATGGPRSGWRSWTQMILLTLIVGSLAGIAGVIVGLLIG